MLYAVFRIIECKMCTSNNFNLKKYLKNDKKSSVFVYVKA